MTRAKKYHIPARRRVEAAAGATSEPCWVTAPNTKKKLLERVNWFHSRGAGTHG